MVEVAYVYILASTFKHLYIGFTTDLEIRVKQHKEHRYPGSFTARYRIDQLIYYERFAYITEAIAREKQLKRWSRIKKLRIIVAQNPTWQDLSADWGKPTGFYKEEESSGKPLTPTQSSPAACS